jgi:hypothetical protein
MRSRAYGVSRRARRAVPRAWNATSSARYDPPLAIEPMPSRVRPHWVLSDGPCACGVWRVPTPASAKP